MPSAACQCCCARSFSESASNQQLEENIRREGALEVQTIAGLTFLTVKICLTILGIWWVPKWTSWQGVLDSGETPRLGLGSQQPHLWGNQSQLHLCLLAAANPEDLSLHDRLLGPGQTSRQHCSRTRFNRIRSGESLWRLNREEEKSGKSFAPVRAASTHLDDGTDAPWQS